MSKLWRHLQWYQQRLGLSAYWRQLVFYCRPPRPVPDGFALPPGFEFRFLRPEELEPLQYPGGWLSLPEARQWLERGDSDMLAAIRDNRICSYLWVERRVARIDFLDLKAPLPAGHVYISKVLVSPAWRRHGLAGAMYQCFVTREPELTAHSACVTDNFPMHALFSKLQWRRRLAICSWRLAGMRWHRMEFVSDGSKTGFLGARRAASLLFSAGESGW